MRGSIALQALYDIVKSRSSENNGVSTSETVQYSEATRRAFERQLVEHGKRSLEKSLAKFERRLAEHLSALEKYKQEGGYTSSVEREIIIFKESIKAIKDILGKE